MKSYYSKYFFLFTLLIPLVAIPMRTSAEKTVKQQQELQEMLSYATNMVAPYDVIRAAVDAALDYHTNKSMTPKDQDDIYIMRGLRERCFPRIRTQLLSANRICTLELGANNATFNNLTVTGNQTINGNLIINGTIINPINPASLCTGGVVTFPCNVQFNSDNNTLNSIGNSVEPVLNFIRGTITPNLTATVVEEPFRNVTIANSPTIVAGSGFTVTATPSVTIFGQEIAIGALVGTITVTFGPSVQYVSRPSITLGTENAPGNTTQAFEYRVTNVTPTEFSIEVINLSTLAIDEGLTLLAGSVNFMAAGQTVG